MGWIKRNLVFVIGGIVALGLLGAGGFYIYQGWARNATAAVKLNEIYGTLKSLQKQSPAPGNDKVDNTALAREQQKQLQAWVATAGKYFAAIPSIPPSDISGETFAAALRRTVNQLQHEADTVGVTLPPQYDFSFSAERPLVRFAEGSLKPLAIQLGEVRAIATIIFSTRVNSLDGIQRSRVSSDDAAGLPSDYIGDQPITNDLAIIAPYVVTVRCFTPELAQMISAFATASNTFLIKAINVQPAGMAGGAGQPNAMAGMPGEFPMGGLPGGYGMPRAAVPAAQPVLGQGGLPIVLKEQLLRVTMEVELVKLRPKS